MSIEQNEQGVPGEPSSKGTGFHFETLPSGRRVPITIRADPLRPWFVQGSKDAFEVVREKRGDSSVLEIYRGGRILPLVLTEQDAQALADRLNRQARAASRRTRRGSAFEDSFA